MNYFFLLHSLVFYSLLVKFINIIIKIIKIIKINKYEKPKILRESEAYKAGADNPANRGKVRFKYRMR